MTTDPTRSIGKALRLAREQLARHAENPSLEAEILLGHILNCSRTTLHTWPERPVDDTQWQQLHAMLDRRVAGEPIAHLTGTREFWDMNLTVTADTLIPRPETEHLVELALERIPLQAQWHIADLGTGSGAIALAIARERPGCHLLATDLSIKALSVARDNAERLGVRNVRFHHSRWFEGLADQRFEMIVSNPPYIHPDDEHLQLGDVRFEPVNALVSGPDGLTDIRAIAEGARQHLTAPGWLLIEHGYDQGAAVLNLLSQLDYQEVTASLDLSGQDRVCIGKWD